MNRNADRRMNRQTEVVRDGADSAKDAQGAEAAPIENGIPEAIREQMERKLQQKQLDRWRFEKRREVLNARDH